MSQDAKILTGIGVVSLLILAGAIFLLGRSNNPSQNPTPIVDTQKLIRSDSYQTATASAKVNLVEFGDYQCPACASANPAVKQLISPDVNLVFRHFPLPMHKNAVAASIAAEAAGSQGKYWEMHHLLYEDQKAWAETASPTEMFSGYALKIGLDVNKFRADLNSQALKDKVERDRQDGISLGVNSTPTFFINGQRIEGLPNFSQFKELINLHLK
jgi:protein-disulfide isomerase